MRGEILGAERRHFWHEVDKLEIVMSVGIDGASVTQVAQRHEIRRQKIYELTIGNLPDLPPEAPSFITRVCGFGFHILRRQFEQREDWRIL